MVAGRRGEAKAELRWTAGFVVRRRDGKALPLHEKNVSAIPRLSMTAELPILGLEHVKRDSLQVTPAGITSLSSAGSDRLSLRTDTLSRVMCATGGNNDQMREMRNHVGGLGA